MLGIAGFLWLLTLYVEIFEFYIGQDFHILQFQIHGCYIVSDSQVSYKFRFSHFILVVLCNNLQWISYWGEVLEFYSFCRNNGR